MAKKKNTQGLKRPVQKFSAEAQAAFQHFTPQDKLEWLENIKQLWFTAQNAKDTRPSLVKDRTRKYKA